MERLENFLQQAWMDYISLTPQAEVIHQALIDHDENIINDHIALRTFKYPGIDLTTLGSLFEKAGYHLLDNYSFPDKHLSASAFFINSDQPKIFISELHIDRLSDENQQIILPHLINSEPIAKDLGFLCSGRPWSLISHQQYQQLATESEYAAWLMVMGYHPNHFTISLNHLKHYSEWENFLTLIESLNIPLNQQGGIIKGSEDVLLEQASTLADEISCTFSDGEFTIKTCFYEFAKRFRNKEGELFHGFVTDNANQIFSSTDINNIRDDGL